MEISNDKKFLKLSFNPARNKFSLNIYPELSDLLDCWSPTSRISPIFGLKEFRDDGFAFESKNRTHYVIFIGPMMPIRLAEFCDSSCGVWLTYGLYNIIVQTPLKSVKDKIVRWLKKRKIRYELWRLNDDLLDRAYLSTQEQPNGDWRSVLSSLSDIDLPLKLDAARDEYCPLMATSIARASSSLSEIVADLNIVNECIGEIINIDGIDELSKQHEVNGILAKTNAGLSRFSSQTFSGTSPITGTECHYWTHSLLGTGMANLALYKLVSYVRDKLGVFNIPARLENLKFEPIKSLNTITPNERKKVVLYF